MKADTTFADGSMSARPSCPPSLLWRSPVTTFDSQMRALRPNGRSMIKSSFLRRCLVLVVLACGATALAQSFEPSLKFCNSTRADVRVATAYDLDGTDEMTSQGWFVVRGCTCRTVIQNVSLRATEVFVIANRNGIGNLLSNPRAEICLRSTQFNFRNQNRSRQACTAAGGQLALFKRYDTQGRDHRVTIRRAGECNPIDHD